VKGKTPWNRWNDWWSDGKREVETGGEVVAEAKRRVNRTYMVVVAMTMEVMEDMFLC
jgi:hypothetical protein